jgi:ribulose-phosphate 3-epimerase
MLTAVRSAAALEVDGGIARDTITRCWRAGADTFVAGNAVFTAPDAAAEIRELRVRCSEQA